MTFKIWDGSVWRDPTFVRRWNGSAWIDVGQASKWTGTAWEQVWPLLAVNITNRFLADANTDGYISYELLSTGVAQRTSGSLGTLQFSGEWLTAGSASSCEVRATLNSGSLTAGSAATGTWLPLSSSRIWFLDFDGNADLTIEIRNASTLAVLDTANVTLSVG
jgi:hypothetical protein